MQAAIAGACIPAMLGFAYPQYEGDIRLRRAGKSITRHQWLSLIGGQLVERIVEVGVIVFRKVAAIQGLSACLDLLA